MTIESPFMTVPELAAYLRLSPVYVKQAASRHPDRLPPPCRPVAGRQRLLWLKSEVDAWIAAGVVAPPAPVRSGYSKSSKISNRDVLQPLRVPALRTL